MSKLDYVPLSGTLPTKFNMDINRRFPHYTNAHWHDFYEIEICLSGRASANINGTEYSIQPGTIQFITPTDFHGYYPETKSFSVINFTFNPACVESFNFSDTLSFMGYMVCNLNEERTNHIIYLIETIEKELNKDSHMNKQYARYLLMCVLIELLRINETSTTEKGISHQTNKHIQKILYYIRTHFKEQITLEDVAAYANLSTGYTCKLFKESLGCRFKQFLINLRLMHAENLLINSDESVSDIAYFCGFTSLSHFLNTFKRKYNTSPRNYRKRHKSANKL